MCGLSLTLNPRQHFSAPEKLHKQAPYAGGWGWGCVQNACVIWRVRRQYAQRGVQSGACAQYVCKCVHVTVLENDILNVPLSVPNIKQVLTCMLKF